MPKRLQKSAKKPGVWSRFSSWLHGFRFGNIASYYGQYYGPFGWLQHLLPGTEYDYRREAGIVWENSIIASCVAWLGRTYCEAPQTVERRGGNRKWIALDDHECLSLLENPNPYYDHTVLMAGTLLSLMSDGNAYWLKVRSRAGKVVGLVYIPHFMIEPRWDYEGTEFITHYEYRISGESLKIAVEDIIHLRTMIDPLNPRKGWTPLAAQLREICGDNEAGTLFAAILRNMGVPGVVITPDTAALKIEDAPQASFDDQQQLKTQWRERWGGDRRGEPAVFDFPVKVQPLSFNPKQLDLAKLRAVSEERICAAIGIPPIVVGMGAGLSNASYSNYREAKEYAYDSLLVPLMRTIDSQLTRQLLSEFEPDDPYTNAPKKFRIGHDLSDVRALAEDENDKHKRAVNDFKGYLLKLNEARQAIGYDKDPDAEKGERYLFELLPTPGGEWGTPAAPGDEDADDNGKPRGSRDDQGSTKPKPKK